MRAPSLTLRLVALLGAAAAWAVPAQAEWQDVATISNTLGNNAYRLCVGGGGSDLGCPVGAPLLDIGANRLTVPGDLRVVGNLLVSGSQAIDGVTFANGGVSATGTISATGFSGDGSGLTGIDFSANPVDRIVSGTSQVLATNNTSVTITTNGAERLVIGSNGNVGIGTPTPSNYRLNVSGSTYLQGGVLVGNVALGVNSARVTSGLDSATYISMHWGQPDLTFHTNSARRMVIASSNLGAEYAGRVGIGNMTYPSTTLHVSGTLRLSNGSESCDANRTGAIKYESGQFMVCRNGTSWEYLVAGSNSTVDTDRITSGTTAVVANTNGNTVSVTTGGTTTAYFHGTLGLVAPGVSATGTVSSADVNTGRVVLRGMAGSVGVSLTDPGDDLGNHTATQDLNMDGHNINNAGNISATAFFGDGSGLTNINASNISGLSTDRITSGTTNILASENTSLTLTTAGTTRMTVGTNGNIGIGSAVPQTRFHVEQTTDGEIARFQRNGGTNVPLLRINLNEASALTELEATGLAASSIAFRTAATERMRIADSGHVGIGTATPSTTLHVNGPIRMATSADACDADRTGAIKYEGGQFMICRNGTLWETLVAGAGGTVNTDRITSGTTGMYTFNNSSATIVTDGYTRVTVTPGGRVGIGLANPSSVLDVSGSTTLRGDVVTFRDDAWTSHSLMAYGTGYYPIHQLLAARGSSAVPSALQSGDILGSLRFNSYGTTGFSSGEAAASLRAVATGNHTDTSRPTDLIFSTANVSQAQAAERMRIGANGNVGIGTAAPAYKLEVLGSADGSAAGQLSLGDGYGGTTGRQLLLSSPNNTTTYSQISMGGTIADLRIGTRDYSSTLHLEGSNGYVGVGTVDPSTALHVNGPIRIATSGNACDANRTGAIKYEGGQFMVCRNGTNWEMLGASTLASLTDVSATSPILGAVLQWKDGKWQAVSTSAIISGSQVAFHVHKNNTAQTVPASTSTKLTWSTKIFDTNNNFSTATGRFTPTVPGIYYFTISAYCDGSSTACQTQITKNGSPVIIGHTTAGSSFGMVNGLVSMNGTTDYVEAVVYNQGGTNINGNPPWTYFQGALVNAVGAPGSGGGATDLGGLTDVTLSSPATGQVLAYNGSNWVNTNANTDRITSGTTAVITNSATATVSLSTAGTTWGYMGATASYIPNLSSNRVSATTISTTAVQVVSDTAPLTCDSGKAGTLRYNSTNTTLELCTGTGWQVMGVGIPAGTISAFASTTCPTGWSEYTPARGRFLRGIDNGAGNDPDGTRTPGAIQGDAIRNITGKVLQFTGNVSVNEAGGSTGAFYGAGSVQYNGSIAGNGPAVYPLSIFYDASRVVPTAAENRPKNVAVTFCQFNGTSNGWNNPLSGGGASTPAGSTGQIQYNTAGSMDANAGLTWDNANQRFNTVNISATAITASASVSSTQVSTPLLQLQGVSSSAGVSMTFSGADNLGDHTATQDLNMGGHNITAAGNIAATGSVQAGNADTVCSALEDYGKMRYNPATSKMFMCRP